MKELVCVDLKDLKMYFLLYRQELLIDDCFDFLYDVFIDILSLYHWETQSDLYHFLTASSYSLDVVHSDYVKVPQDMFEGLIDLPEAFYDAHISYWKTIYEKYESVISDIKQHNKLVAKMQGILQ